MGARPSSGSTSTTISTSTRKPSDLPGGTRWVFDHDFFIILNVAVGGAWPGNPDGTAVFPQQMKVDYVKVYRR